MSRLLMLTAVCLLTACATPENSTDLLIQGELFEVVSPSVELSLESRGDLSYCIPAYQVSPYYGTFTVFNRNGLKVVPKESANREIQIFKGVDLVDGLLVITPFKKKVIRIPLENYDIDLKNIGSVELKLQQIECKSLFQGEPIIAWRNIKIQG